jgi:predicted nucleic acid-binding Zn ribbon protein
VRRPAPRPLSSALAGALSGARPATLLARVQAAWPEVAGGPLAAVTTPVAEREGVVTITCESALWAHELDLLQRDLLERLAERLKASGEGSVQRLRFTVGSLPNDP